MRDIDPFRVRMMPGQEPYTERELRVLYGLVADASTAEEQIEDMDEHEREMARGGEG